MDPETQLNEKFRKRLIHYQELCDMTIAVSESTEKQPLLPCSHNDLLALRHRL